MKKEKLNVKMGFLRQWVELRYSVNDSFLEVGSMK
jgi:hypothetical protein